MNENPFPEGSGEHEEIGINPRERTLWQKIGAGSLSISVICNVMLLVVGLFWMLKVIPPKEEPVRFLPPGGGDARGTDSQADKKRARLMQPDLSRTVTIDAIGGLTLPEPENVPQVMTSMESPGSGSLSAGLGGKGGGSLGNRHGPGTGDSLIPGLVGEGGTGNPFGMIDPNKGALVGSFYDLKQTKDGKPTGMTDTRMREELMEITRRGFKDSVFNNYFKAPRKLYQTRFYIPTIPADGAPAAFEVEKEVQPRMWVVVYRGAVKAPKSGKFRFVGECDDFLVVRFNNRPVFDYGYTMAGTGTHVNGRADEFNGTNENPELAKEVRKLTPMKLPITMYKYANTAQHNQMIGGLAVGPEFQVEAGKTYPIEIMIGEIPGGYFSLELLIEEIGASCEKDPAGYPILPLFRLDNGLPGQNPEAAPFDPKGPIWPFAPGGAGGEI